MSTLCAGCGHDSVSIGLGQFTATADRGSMTKKSAINPDSAIDLASLDLHLGTAYVARGFGADKA